MSNRFFIKDAALDNDNSDFFGHLDFAKNIVNILDTQIPPYNIAIIGRWGLGKSSLINFVANTFSKSNKFEFVTINAWKYEKEAFRKVFLKKTWERLGGSEKNWAIILRDALNSVSVIETQIAGNRTWKSWAFPLLSFSAKAGGIFVIICLFSLMWRFLGFCITQGFSLPTFAPANGNASVFSIYDATIKTFYSNALVAGAIPVGFTLVKEFLSSYEKKTSKHYNLISPAKTTDDYESLLLDQLQRDENKDKTIVTVIDDLDRLDANKIIDALDAIKSFSDIKQCIFLVPFDEEKIQEAISEAKKTNNGASSNIISELLLDKLFQFRVYLPGIIKRDFIPYTKDLCINECPDLVTLCNKTEKDCFDDYLLPILIHYHIDTPRQIKKIMNVFANNLLALTRRINSNKINLSIKLDTLVKLAKLSVLQADFVEFYNALYKNPSLLTEFSEIYEFKQKDETPDLSQDAQELYERLSQSMQMFELLLDFLSNNRHISITDNEVRSLIYLSDSKAAMRAGGIEQKLADALSVGDGQKAKDVISNIDNPCDYLINELLEGQLSRSVEKQYLVAIYALYGALDLQSRSKLANVVSRKTEIALNSYSFTERSSISISDIIQIFIESSDKTGAEKLLIIKTEELFASAKTNQSKETLSKSVNAIIKNTKSLSIGITVAFRENFLPKVQEENASYSVIDLVNNLDILINKDIYIKLFTEDFVHTLSKSLEENEIISGKPFEMFLAFWDVLVELDQADRIPEIVYILLQKFSYLDLLYDRILNSKNKFGDGLPLLIEAITQIEVTDSNSERICDLLEQIDWEVYDGISNDIDTLLVSLNKDQRIDKLLKKIADKDQFEKIPNTIETISGEIFNTEGDYFAAIDWLCPRYTDEQRDSLISKLTTNLQPTVAVETVDSAVAVFKALQVIPEFEIGLSTIKNNLVALFNANHSRQPQWRNLVVEIAGYKHNTEETANNSYLTVLNNYFATDVSLSIKGWKNVHGTVPTSALTTMLTNFFELDYTELSEDDLQSMFGLLSYWKKQILESVEFTEKYEEFLIVCLKQGIYIDWCVRILDTFQAINKLSQIFIVATKSNEKKMMKISTLIVNKIKSSNDKVKLTNDLFVIQTEFDAGLAKRIIIEVFDSPVIDYINVLLPNVNDKTNYYFMVNLLAVITRFSLAEFKKSDVLNLIKTIVRKNNKKCADDIVGSLQLLKGYFISNRQKFELKGCLETVQATSKTNAETIKETLEMLGLNMQPKKEKKYKKRKTSTSANNEVSL